MPKISVIMPCLNMEKYIAESLESVINQTLDDIEILIIDAGSTDGTLNILQSYVNNDIRVKVFHSEKKSYGYQVNLGIRYSCGEYITIVDTDDRIVPDMYETLYAVAHKTGADYVKGTVDYFYTVEGKYVYCQRLMQFPKSEYSVNGIEVTPKDMPEILRVDGFVWDGIYKNEFFKKVKFHESPGAAYQDLGGLLQTLLNAEKAVYIEKMVYEYRQDNMDASGYNPKAFEFIVNEYKWCEQFLEGKSEAWKATFYYKYFTQVVSRFNVMDNLGCFWNGTEKATAQIRECLRNAVEEGILDEWDFEPWLWEYFQFFMDSSERLYTEIGKGRQQNRVALCRILQKVTERKIVIFGSGKLGSFMHLLLLHNHVENIAAFCDNNKSLEGTIMYDLPIITPQKAVHDYPEAVFIIANRRHTAEMGRQLLRLGIPRKNIIICNVRMDINLFKRKWLPEEKA